MSKIKKVKSLKMLIVDADGSGNGLNTVKANEVSSTNVRKIIGGTFTKYPFKMVYKGKKYWMLMGSGNSFKYQTEWFMPFTAGMLGVEFVYDFNNKPAHEEDLKFNGFSKTSFMGQYAIPVHGPMVFIEDIGNNEICSDYWECAV